MSSNLNELLLDVFIIIFLFFRSYQQSFPPAPPRRWTNWRFSGWPCSTWDQSRERVTPTMNSGDLESQNVALNRCDPSYILILELLFLLEMPRFAVLSMNWSFWTSEVASKEIFGGLNRQKNCLSGKAITPWGGETLQHCLHPAT